MAGFFIPLSQVFTYFIRHMKRRDFIKTQGLIWSALWLNPSSLLKSLSCTKNLFKGKKKLDQKRLERFEITICLESIKNFENAANTDKIFNLTINHYPDKKDSKNYQTYSATYVLTSVKKDDEFSYTADAEFVSYESLNYRLPKDFSPKSINFSLRIVGQKNYIYLHDKYNMVYVSTVYDPNFR